MNRYDEEFDEDNTRKKNIDPYLKEKIYLAKRYNVRQSLVLIKEHLVVGEVCIYINNKWIGYLDDFFYSEKQKYEIKNKSK